MLAQAVPSTGPDPNAPGSDVTDLEAVEPNPRRRFQRVDAAIMGGYLLFALAVTSSLWRHPNSRYLPITDQYGFEWVIATVTRAILHGQNPFFTDGLNAPLGINLMAQTSIIGLTVPMIPVTLLFGPAVTFVALLTLSLAGTAAAWYWVLSRHLVDSRAGAAIAGALCGFATPMISHAGGAHLNYIAWFVIPFIAWRVIELRTKGRWLRNGIILGLLITWQVFIGEEPLLVAALAIGVWVVAWAVMNRREARAQAPTFLAGLAVAGVLSGALLAYPLWFQFTGPQSYGAIPHLATVGNNLFSLTTFGSQSIGGMHPVGYLAYNGSEENGFFGWPLLALTTIAAVWLWRSSMTARVAAITAGAFLLLSMGVELRIAGRNTGLPLPWKVFAEIPLVGSILPARLAFAAIPAIGIVLAIATARVIKLTPGGSWRDALRADLPVRLLWLGAVVAVLLPIAPSRLDVYERPVAPEFFSSGAWRDFAAPGRSIVAVPPPGGLANYQVAWQIAAGMEFNHVEGYFIGPWGKDGHGWYGVENFRPTSALLTNVANTGTVPPVIDAMRAQAVEDLRYWQADAVVLDPTSNHAEEVRQILDQLLGPGRNVGGVWAWDVRPLVRG
jgi:hypothetical protein